MMCQSKLCRGAGCCGALLVVGLLLPAVLALSARPAAAQGPPLVADLSNHLIAITTGFAGTDVLLFGAVDEPGDVVVVVRGPSEAITLHRKSRVLGIWINTASATFDQAPSFYTIASSRPLEEIASETVLRRHQMGLDKLRLEIDGRVSPNLAAEWRDALIRNKREIGHYGESAEPVVFLGSRLFRVRLSLPANVPTGTYLTEVYFLKEGRVVSAQTTPLIVSKVGLEAEIFNLAHNQSALYGVIAILVALVAGWLGNMAFRKA